jgi:TetR/AcrR family fatty acid metabolism transcriptional regulator
MIIHFGMNTLKDKLALSRRAHIAEAALMVFAAKGYHRATIRDVAKAAGVADGTIYQSFANKEALLLALLDPLGELATAAEGPASDAATSDAPMPDVSLSEPRAALREKLRLRLAAFTADRLDALRVVLSEVLVTPELRAVFLARVLKPTYELPVPDLAALHAAGAVNAPDAGFTARAMTATVLGLVMLRLIGDERIEAEWDGLADPLADFVLDGLMARTDQEPRG